VRPVAQVSTPPSRDRPSKSPDGEFAGPSPWGRSDPLPLVVSGPRSADTRQAESAAEGHIVQEGSAIPASNAPAAAIPATGRRGGAVVVLAGAVTTALALLGVWWLDNNTDDFHVMGWYADYVIPAGALLVGMAAGSGYGIASYLGGLRIRRGLLLSVVMLQLAGYSVAQYLEFRSLTREGPLVDASGETLTFARFYHLRAMSFAWDDHGHPGKPVGGWGYLFVGLGVLGFALGGVVVPALLMKAPYCERCELYMKSRVLALVPASGRPRRVGKKDAAG